MKEGADSRKREVRGFSNRIFGSAMRRSGARNHVRAIAVLSIVLASLYCPGLAADLYRWVDEGGTVHYSEHPPDAPGKSFESVTLPESRPAPGQDLSEVSVPFTRGSSGEMVVKVVLNGWLPVDMVVDPGASLVVIPEETARQLNLERTQTKRRLVLRGIGGETEAYPVLLPRLDVSGAAVENLPSAVVASPEFLGGHGGLLGLSFLKHFNLSIDYRRGLVRLQSAP